MEPNLRRCLSCRKIAAKSDLWRIVRVHPSHAVHLFQGAGRSAYLCPTAACLQQAQKKNRLGRALKAPISPALYEELRSILEVGTTQIEGARVTQPLTTVG